jgi:hypothetical protein
MLLVIKIFQVFANVRVELDNLFRPRIHKSLLPALLTASLVSSLRHFFYPVMYYVRYCYY